MSNMLPPPLRAIGDGGDEGAATAEPPAASAKDGADVAPAFAFTEDAPTRPFADDADAKASVGLYCISSD